MAPNPAAASVERLWDAVRLDTGDPLFVLYGPGAADTFVCRDYQERRIEEALWEMLDAEGFERIVFSSARYPVYFRDDRSQHRTRRRGERRRPAPDAGARRMRFFSGPQGDRMELAKDRDQGSDPTGERASGARSRGTLDPHAVMFLDACMRDHEVRTAIVLIHAEQFLNFIGARRELAETVAEWIEASGNGNRCLLLFNSLSWDEVIWCVERLGHMDALRAFLKRQQTRRAGRSASRIEEPDLAELERLVHLARVRFGLRLEDWRELQAVVRVMAAQQGVGARAWLDRLRSLAGRDDGVPLSVAVLRERGLVDAALTDGRSAWDRLSELVGLTVVKGHVRRLQGRAEAEAARRKRGRGPRRDPPSLHLVFSGNPGTGKTMVAELIGELYRDLGLLRSGHVEAVEAQHLVADVVGGTAIRTNQAVDRALHGVLLIDEAYRLSDQRAGFGQEAVDTLLTRMEHDRDRLVVIAAGYPAKMRQFLESNPGLERRFPQANRIDFPDYEPEELLAVLLAMLGERELAWDPELEARLREVTAGLYRTRDERFGNAGAMRNLADELESRWAERVKGVLDEPLRLEDLPDWCLAHLQRPVPTPQEILTELDELVGLGSVKDAIRRLVMRLQHERRLGTGGTAAPHMLFLGPPGTGKTTVARLMGRVLQSLGLLNKGHVVEVTRQHLVAEYVGQTAPKTAARIRAALDGVLFIDEAYSLARGGEHDFGQEVIDTLTPAMTNQLGRLVVIAAGYPEPMRRFLGRNEGLASRFTWRVEFPSYSGPELLEILRRTAAQRGYTLTPGAERRALAVLEAEQARDPASFGNGRAVHSLLERLQEGLAQRTFDLPDDTDLAVLTRFEPEDVPDVPG